MRVVVLYHPNNDEFSGAVKDYAAEFERYKRKKLELISLETPDGAYMADLYAIDRYPAVMVISDTGALLRLWQGAPLPLMDELSYYVPDITETASPVGRTIMPAHA